MPQIIYMITCKTTGKKYIGQTNLPLNIRWNSHLTDAKREKLLISKAIKRHGKDQFDIIELVHYEDNTLTEEELNLLEEYYIAEFDSQTPNGYNISPGGGKQAASTRDKIALARKLHFANMTPEEKLKAVQHLQQFQPFTEDIKQKMSKAKKENWEDPEYRQKMEQTLVKARKAAHTPEAEKRKGASLVKNRRYKLTSPTGEVFEVTGLHQFAIEHSLDASGLQKVAKGKLKHYKQWQCECLDDSGIRPERHDAYLKLKRYELTSPNGVQFCTYGLEHLKDSYNLTPTHLRKVAAGKLPHHKYWNCKTVD
jgi:group I intron endonuclease